MALLDDVVDRFDAAVAATRDPSPAGSVLLPSRLAHAAATALQVDGASLSLLSLDLRVPLGASSPAASAAERLQFTLGEGPCLEVLHRGRASRSDAARLVERWPQFHRRLVAATPFRAVVAVPLPFTARGGGGALDLYSVRPDGDAGIDLAEAAVVADRVVETLVLAQAPSTLAGVDDASKVPWLGGADTVARMEVWVAIGMLSAQLTLDAAEALAALRGWADGHDTDLEALAADLVDGRLDPELLRS